MNGGSPNGPSMRLRGAEVLIAAHLAAVSLIYEAALVVGGGFASAPFPPDLPIKARQPSLPRAPAGLAEHHLPEAPQVLVPATSDVAPPWNFDADGRVRFIPADSYAATSATRLLRGDRHESR